MPLFSPPRFFAAIALLFSLMVCESGVIAAPTHGLSLKHLRCEYTENPRGIEIVRPRLSWESVSPTQGQRQSAYQVLAARSLAALSRNEGNVWNSGKVISDRSLEIAYAGAALRSGQTYWWKVRLWDKDGRPSPFSPAAYWQMGLLHKSDWKAHWISAATPRTVQDKGLTLPPCAYLRQTFTLTKRIKRATLAATARGVYELHLNGARVGNALFTPGWTDYRKHLQYQMYDITKRLRRGTNTVGAVLGDGWYSGYVGFGGQRGLYGDPPQFLAQLTIEYADGTRQLIVTDNSWRGASGPILSSDLLMGETYNARLEHVSAAWKPVIIDAPPTDTRQVNVTRKVKEAVKDNTLTLRVDNSLAGDPAYGTVKQLRVDYTLNGKAYSRTVPENATLQIPGPGRLIIHRAIYSVSRAQDGALVATLGPPVRVIQELKARKITQPSPGVYIYDLGQNMVGWARLKVEARAGTRIQLRFGEMLNPNGTLYTTNLRSARATDTYICRGSGLVETWEPHFTFHGFRYVEVTGYPGRPRLAAITGRVVSSDTPRTGTFVCSNPLVNQLQSNIVWGQRGNFLSVPTDCPQRDERLGWMGDAQIFARTATYNSDVAEFYEKWMRDVSDAQSKEGGFSDVSPRIVDNSDGAPAWGDAGIIVPWTVYQAYGDTGILHKHWASMTRWLDYITTANPNGLWLQRRNNDFGDWLSIGADTPKDVLATAYYAYDAHLMAQMARALGKPKDEAKYNALWERVKQAFNAAYVSPAGQIKGDTQTGYALALHFGLLPKSLRPQAAQYLTDDIARKGGHLSTGFVGVGYLCPALTETGHNDTAYRLLLNTTFPSWGYSIKQGATTIWERWDGWTPDKGFQTPGMNSFNHYSLGSVGQWLYQSIAGIDTDPNHPGYKHSLLHPHPGLGLTYVRASLATPYGLIRSEWRTLPKRFIWHIVLPANTTATVWVPCSKGFIVTESKSLGIKFLRTEPGSRVYEIGSGSYHFNAAPPKPLVLTHYMPWFQAKPFHSQWGWHWTMNHFNPDTLKDGQREIASHYSPLIGPYDSGDTDALQCQALLMKFAGIDGAIIDWYGNDAYLDYGANNQNTLRFLPILRQAGLRFAICYEDQTVATEIAGGVFPGSEALAHGQRLTQWMQTHFFSSPAYLTLNGRPVLLSFGEPYYQGSQWNQLFAALPQKPLYFTETVVRARTATAGAFDWPLPGGGTEKALQEQDAFTLRAKGCPLSIAAAFPRFHDVYAQAGIGKSWGTIEDRAGRTYADTLRKAIESHAPFIQIVTWNDWGEGTQIEPSVQYGYRDLTETQRVRRQSLDPHFAYTDADLRLPVEWYRLRRRFANVPAVSHQLAAFFPLAAAGHLERARALLLRSSGQ